MISISWKAIDYVILFNLLRMLQTLNNNKQQKQPKQNVAHIK